ncbi:MAG: helix-turn-helix domain-containing protein [Burkholderiales bacterium]|nr:helix-turn-helix domain-containing protein [Burkholderiales bacterium]
MRLPDIGFRLRQARNDLGLTQAQLARAAGVSRTTLNQLENGLIGDLGVQRLRAILAEVGLALTLVPDSVAPDSSAASPDFIRMAASSASVSYKTPLSEDALIRILLTGSVPAALRPHLRSLLDEASPALLKGLVETVSRWSKPGRVEKNLVKIADTLNPVRKVDTWLTSA